MRIKSKVIPNYEENREYYERHPDLMAGWFIILLLLVCIILSPILIVLVFLDKAYRWGVFH